jgi:hypothetical protein
VPTPAESGTPNQVFRVKFSPTLRLMTPCVAIPPGVATATPRRGVRGTPASSDQQAHSARESHHTKRFAQNGGLFQDRGEKVSAGANHPRSLRRQLREETPGCMTYRRSHLNSLLPQTFSLHTRESGTFSTLLKDFSLVLTEDQSLSRSFFSTLTLETTDRRSTLSAGKEKSSYNS